MGAFLISPKNGTKTSFHFYTLKIYGVNTISSINQDPPAQKEEDSKQNMTHIKGYRRPRPTVNISQINILTVMT